VSIIKAIVGVKCDMCSLRMTVSDDVRDNRDARADIKSSGWVTKRCGGRLVELCPKCQVKPEVIK
jgi:hypothetical protein